MADEHAIVLHTALLLAVDHGQEWAKLAGCPLSPSTFDGGRPNSKALDAALFLLYRRVQGAPRAKKVRVAAVADALEPAQRARLEPACPPARRGHSALRCAQELRGCWPILEPSQHREFRSLMHAWVRDLGAAARLPADVVRRFPTAYQAAAGPLQACAQRVELPPPQRRARSG